MLSGGSSTAPAPPGRSGRAQGAQRGADDAARRERHRQHRHHLVSAALLEQYATTECLPSALEPVALEMKIIFFWPWRPVGGERLGYLDGASVFTSSTRRQAGDNSSCRLLLVQAVRPGPAPDSPALLMSTSGHAAEPGPRARRRPA